jgi:hypothetical protein
MSLEIQPIEEPDKVRRKKILDILFEGRMKGSDIIKYIEKEYRVTRDTALTDLKIVREEIKSLRERNLIFVIHDHMERYEWLYQKFMKIGRSDLANKALKQKEAIAGLHKLTLQDYSFDSDFESDELKKQFDLGRLTKEQKKQFELLFAKAIKDKNKKERELAKGKIL